jgi:uncharacterized protein YdeI (YjbR/CyaY-like superfamily)
MVSFATTIQKFDKQGEKTGWTYIQIPEELAQQLKPNNKKSFRVKGLLDQYPIIGVALLPMGGGDFILALNTAMRKAIGKQKGQSLQVQLEEDTAGPKLCADLLDCLSDEPEAKDFFSGLAPSHQLYFSKWIESAKTEGTRTRRLAIAVNALSKRMDYGQMIRQAREDT